MSKKPVALAIAVAVVFASSSPLPADVFSWADDQGVVHFTDDLNNVPENHRNSATRIRSRGASNRIPPDAAPTGKTSVPLQRNGPIVIVQATLNDRVSSQFVVDTGASYTMISAATARGLDIDLTGALPTVSLQTANGVILAPVVSVDSIDVGGAQVKGLMTVVHDVFPDPSIGGLLGLNFLSKFRLDIDTENGWLHLEKKF